MRLRKIAGAREALAGYQDLVLTEAEKYRGKWREVFGNDRPLHVEIGMGRGKFIYTLAGKIPDINFIGLEFREELILKAVERYKVFPKNLLFLLVDAKNILNVFVPGEAARIYLNFSDPWPKKKHAKRRLTHRKFLSCYREILIPNGEIHFKTDNKALFEFSLNEFADSGFYLKNITLDLHQSGFLNNITTEYEERFMRTMPIYRCEAQILNPERKLPRCFIDKQ